MLCLLESRSMAVESQFKGCNKRLQRPSMWMTTTNASNRSNLTILHHKTKIVLRVWVNFTFWFIITYSYSSGNFSLWAGEEEVLGSKVCSRHVDISRCLHKYQCAFLLKNIEIIKLYSPTFLSYKQQAEQELRNERMSLPFHLYEGKSKSLVLNSSMY